MRLFFYEDHVERILCIPLVQSKPINELVWRHEGFGEYSSKSGYRLLDKELQNKGLNSTAMPNLVTTFYINLWTLQLRTKIKIRV